MKTEDVSNGGVLFGVFAMATGATVCALAVMAASWGVSWGILHALVLL